MEARELRIGNWVCFMMDKYGQIEFLKKDVLGVGGTSWSYKSIQPIPLTPEILEKIHWGGYNKFCINSYFKIDDVGHLYYCGDYTGINIKYLHQLQNLYFALTGQELEINL